MSRKWLVTCTIYRGDQRESVKTEATGSTMQAARVVATQRLEKENPGCHVMAGKAVEEKP